MPITTTKPAAAIDVAVHRDAARRWTPVVTVLDADGWPITERHGHASSTKPKAMEQGRHMARLLAVFADLRLPDPIPVRIVS